MARQLSSRRILIGLAVVCALGAGILFWILSTSGSDQQSREVIGHPMWALDRSDDRQLAGAAHDIFFGRIIQQSSEINRDGIPHRQFEVEVLEVLKGSLSGTVTVDQEGGNYADGVNYRVEGDNLLELGESYFFATRKWAHKDWYTVVPEYGDVKLDVPDSASKAHILASEDAAAMRTRFIAAVADPIPFPYD